MVGTVGVRSGGWAIMVTVVVALVRMLSELWWWRLYLEAVAGAVVGASL